MVGLYFLFIHSLFNSLQSSETVLSRSPVVSILLVIVSFNFTEISAISHIVHHFFLLEILSSLVFRQIYSLSSPSTSLATPSQSSLFVSHPVTI